MSASSERTDAAIARANLMKVVQLQKEKRTLEKEKRALIEEVAALKGEEPPTANGNGIKANGNGNDASAELFTQLGSQLTGHDEITQLKAALLAYGIAEPTPAAPCLQPGCSQRCCARVI